MNWYFVVSGFFFGLVLYEVSLRFALRKEVISIKGYQIHPSKGNWRMRYIDYPLAALSSVHLIVVAILEIIFWFNHRQELLVRGVQYWFWYLPLAIGIILVVTIALIMFLEYLLFSGHIDEIEYAEDKMKTYRTLAVLGLIEFYALLFFIFLIDVYYFIAQLVFSLIFAILGQRAGRYILKKKKK